MSDMGATGGGASGGTSSGGTSSGGGGGASGGSQGAPPSAPAGGSQGASSAAAPATARPSASTANGGAQRQGAPSGQGSSESGRESPSEAQSNSETVAQAVSDAGGAGSVDLAGPDGDRMLTLKMDGQDVTMSMRDWLHDARLSKTSKKRMEEAALGRKRNQEFAEFLHRQPAQAIGKMGPEVARRAMRDLYRMAIDPNADPVLKQIAHEELNAMVEDARRPPEELEREQKLRSLDEREKKITEREKKLAEQDEVKKTEHWKGVLERDLSAALRSVRVEPTPRNVGAIARHFETLAGHGFPMDETTYREAARMVASELAEQDKASTGKLQALRGAELAKALTPEQRQSLRELDLAETTGGLAPTQPRAPTGQFAPAPKPSHYLSEDEMLDQVAKKRGW